MLLWTWQRTNLRPILVRVLLAVLRNCGLSSSTPAKVDPCRVSRTAAETAKGRMIEIQYMVKSVICKSCGQQERWSMCASEPTSGIGTPYKLTFPASINKTNLFTTGLIDVVQARSHLEAPCREGCCALDESAITRRLIIPTST